MPGAYYAELAGWLLCGDLGRTARSSLTRFRASLGDVPCIKVLPVVLMVGAFGGCKLAPDDATETYPLDDYVLLKGQSEEELLFWAKGKTEFANVQRFGDGPVEPLTLTAKTPCSCRFGPTRHSASDDICLRPRKAARRSTGVGTPLVASYKQRGQWRRTRRLNG